MDMAVIGYSVYLPAAGAVTFWVARVLGRNGRVFLADVFHGSAALADAVNQLLVVGFYLVNLGFIGLWMKTGTPPRDARGILEDVAFKLGTVLLVVGVLHVVNVFVLNTMRRRGLDDQRYARAVESAGRGPVAAVPAGR